MLTAVVCGGTPDLVLGLEEHLRQCYRQHAVATGVRVGQEVQHVCGANTPEGGSTAGIQVLLAFKHAAVQLLQFTQLIVDYFCINLLRLRGPVTVSSAESTSEALQQGQRQSAPARNVPCAFHVTSQSIRLEQANPATSKTARMGLPLRRLSTCNCQQSQQRGNTHNCLHFDCQTVIATKCPWFGSEVLIGNVSGLLITLLLHWLSSRTVTNRGKGRRCGACVIRYG